jgi:hypothetical protein
VKVWEPKLLAEIVARRDPRIPPDVPRAAIGVTVAEFLDTYYANYVEAEGLGDPATIRGRLKAIKAVLGNQPVTVAGEAGRSRCSQSPTATRRNASWVVITAGGERPKPGARVDRAKLRQIDLHWHDLRHEGACRLLAEHVDIRTIQLMRHADIMQTQRYLNIMDEELRKAMTRVWERRRQLKAVGQSG